MSIFYQQLPVAGAIVSDGDNAYKVGSDSTTLLTLTGGETGKTVHDLSSEWVGLNTGVDSTEALFLSKTDELGRMAKRAQEAYEESLNLGLDKLHKAETFYELVPFAQNYFWNRKEEFVAKCQELWLKQKPENVLTPSSWKTSKTSSSSIPVFELSVTDTELHSIIDYATHISRAAEYSPLGFVVLANEDVSYTVWRGGRHDLIHLAGYSVDFDTCDSVLSYIQSHLDFDTRRAQYEKELANNRGVF